MEFPYRTIMVQGTTSDAGKSTLVAAMCRLLVRAGVRCVPFKPQNMANNSAVTSDGGEIGRAQALQAVAARLQPHTDMNPVLLKPSSSIGAQIVIHGRVRGDMSARDYLTYKTTAMTAVLESYNRLSPAYDVVVVEGAGSPAEINLRARDIANMGFAETVDCPVIIIADIDKGGVFAHIVGTLECLSESERARVVGFVINRFRGDISMLQGGLDWLEQRTGRPVLAVLPYLHGLALDAEDAVPLTPSNASPSARILRVVVPIMPHISNHTDFDSLRQHPQVEFTFVKYGMPVPPADLIIIAGSKSTITDLAFLRASGWEDRLRRHLRYGGKVIGVCGGFQMLGGAITDPLGVDGASGQDAFGFGLLDIETEMSPEKRLAQVEGQFAFADATVTGYEIHMGVSKGKAMSRPSFIINGQPEGARSEDDQVLGSYIHGLFDHPEALATLLKWAGLDDAVPLDLAQLREQSIDRIADAAAPVIESMLKLTTTNPNWMRRSQSTTAATTNQVV
eukprot:gene4328-5055_t